MKEDIRVCGAETNDPMIRTTASGYSSQRIIGDEGQDGEVDFDVSIGQRIMKIPEKGLSAPERDGSGQKRLSGQKNGKTLP